MLRWRLILGTLLIAALVALCWLDFGWPSHQGKWLLPLALLLTWAATREYFWLLEARDLRPVRSVVYVANLLLVASVVFPRLAVEGRPLDWTPVVLGLATLAIFLAEMRRYVSPGTSITNAALSFLGIAYVGLLMSFLVRLRFLSGGVPLVLLIAVVKMGDIGAYTVGRLLGRHKMTPVLSPGKTWEGAIGAVVFACIGSTLVLRVLTPLLVMAPVRYPYWWCIVLGVVVGIAGMLGDLAESLLKRDMGRKDSSDWMPGFGGVLDILDSILFAAPVVFVAWICLTLFTQ